MKMNKKTGCWICKRTKIASDYETFIHNFKTLKAHDINVYDECATTLDSKSSMTKISRDIIKLFNVSKAKQYKFYFKEDKD